MLICAPCVSSLVGVPVLGLSVEVRDAAGALIDAAVTLTILRPDGFTQEVAVTHDGLGLYSAAWASTIPGRHLARWVASGPVTAAREQILDIRAAELALVHLAEIRGYLGATSATDSEILDALTAEQAAQAHWCWIDPYPSDLREALLRRIARNLAARRAPVAKVNSYDTTTGASAVVQLDSEIARLEGPYLKPGFA